MREFWVPFADKRYKRKETRNHRLRHLLRLGQRPTPAAAEDESGDNIGRRAERILRVCAQTRFAAIEGGRAAKNRREKDLGDKDCNPQNCASRSLRQRRLATKRSIYCTFSRLSIARASSALPSAYRKGCFALRRLRLREKRQKRLPIASCVRAGTISHTSSFTGCGRKKETKSRPQQAAATTTSAAR